MPNVRIVNPDPVLAIACSDVHLSLKPPIARAQEKNWLEAMGRPWTEIKKLSFEYLAPILCAGDIFDRWNAPTELVNWALDNLPDMFAIPGNHDLPEHRMEGEHRSAYGVLVRAGKIIDLNNDPTEWKAPNKKRLLLYGFPFGGKGIKPVEGMYDDALHIALTHEYMWIPSTQYPGAPEEGRLRKEDKRFAGFDVVIVGDNHVGFEKHLSIGTNVFNCGTLMRRKSSEVNLTPQVGLIHASGKITPYHLDTSKDVITELVDRQDDDYDVGVALFVEELAGLEAADLSFRDAMMIALERSKVSESVRNVLLEALGEN